MIVNLFRQTQALSILSVFLLAIGTCSVFSYQEYSELSHGYSPLYKFIFPQLLANPFLVKFITGALIFWQAVRVNKLMVGQGIYSTNTFYPALFFVLTIGLASDFSPITVALLFLILSLHKTINCYLAKSAHTLVFESAFLLSIAVLIHPPFLLFAPLIWIGMSIFSLGDRSYWVLSVLGLLCPLIIAYSFGVYAEIQNANWRSLFIFLEHEQIPSQFSSFDYLSLFIYGVALIIATIEVVTSLRKKKIKARKSFILILWLLVFQLIFLLVDPSPYSSKLQVLALPGSIFLSNYYYYKRTTKWIKTGLYLLVLTALLHLFWV